MREPTRHFIMMIALALPILPTQAGELPPDAKLFLASLPGQTLTVDLVVSQAIKSSDSFAALRAQTESLHAPELLASAQTDTRVYAKFAKGNDEREPTNPSFSPTRIQGTTWTLGAARPFTTGTTLSAELGHGSSALRFNTLPAIDRFETKASATISQNLWQDAFGSGLRASLKSGRMTSEANLAAWRESAEGWSLDLIQIYYGAWLAQEQLRAARSSVARRGRLLAITQLKLKRGTSELPDLLQVKSAVAGARIQEAQTLQVLGDRLRNLITALKLPRDWMLVDPDKIPLAIDQPVDLAAQACGKGALLATKPATSAGTEKIRLLAEAAELTHTQARAQQRPDLEASLTVAANGTDPTSRSSTWTETTALDHTAWQAGVSLTLPIGFSAEKARRSQAAADALKMDALRSQAVAGLETDWLNACLDLARVTESNRSLKEAAEMQAERARLEEERFRVGRSSTLQVIQAGDDSTSADLSHRASEIELRSAAWRVRRLSGSLLGYLRTQGVPSL